MVEEFDNNFGILGISVDLVEKKRNGGILKKFLDFMK